MPTVAITDYTFANLDLETSVLTSGGVEVVSSKEKLPPAETAELVRGADAVITQFTVIDAEVIAAMDRAKVIVRYGVGYDNVDIAAAAARGIPVLNIPDYCVHEVADHALALILATNRQVVPNALHLRDGQWGMATPLANVHALASQTVGVVGFGRIGREVVRRLLAFRARVLVFDPAVDAAEITAAGAEPASIDDVLTQSDIITPHCPSLTQTKRMFNAAAFAKMKPGAVFVNVTRGDLADSDDLLAALQSGHLGSAALDVFDPEPIPADHPIRSLPNVILAAHIAWASPAAVVQLRTTAAELALRAIRGEPLPNIVNGVTGARV